jgi:xanthine dehydrogenase/oxidase
VDEWSTSCAPASPAPAAGDATATFSLNGRSVKVTNPDPSLTLLDYLRYTAGLTGTKGSCRQGGCGACTVMMDGLAINACLRPLAACDGKTLLTVEGFGNARDGYSKVQDAIAKGNGSQCGFCTPGMVMNMHSLLATKPEATVADVEAHFDGNICRCTGYRPILAAFHQLVTDEPGVATGCCTSPCAGNFSGAASTPPKHFTGRGSEWIEPTALSDLAGAIRRYERE